MDTDTEYTLDDIDAERTFFQRIWFSDEEDFYRVANIINRQEQKNLIKIPKLFHVDILKAMINEDSNVIYLITVNGSFRNDVQRLSKELSLPIYFEETGYDHSTECIFQNGKIIKENRPSEDSIESLFIQIRLYDPEQEDAAWEEEEECCFKDCWNNGKDVDPDIKELIHRGFLKPECRTTPLLRDFYKSYKN